MEPFAKKGFAAALLLLLPTSVACLPVVAVAQCPVVPPTLTARADRCGRKWNGSAIRPGLGAAVAGGVVDSGVHWRTEGSQVIQEQRRRCCMRTGWPASGR